MITATALASVLSLTHVTNKPGTSARSNFNTSTPIGSPINISLRTPIYVVGPQSLVQGLVGVGIPQSLIKPISLSQLPSLPSNSIAVIDWSVIRPYVAYGTVGGNITLNLTSPAVGLLANLFAKGDLVLVNVSRSEAPVAELLLSYAMARGANVVVYGTNGTRFYLIPMLEMPTNSNYTLVGAAAIRTPYRVAVLVGPVSLEGLPNLFRNWLASIETAKGDKPSTNLDPSYQNWDPCYVTYANDFSASQGSNSIYTSGNYIFLWGMQALASQGAHYSYDYGIAAVEDNYGDVFYYDSCILMINHPAISSSSSTVALPAELIGDVAYGYTYSGEVWPGFSVLFYLIGGFDMYKSYEAMGNEVEFNGICYLYTYNAYVADGYGQYEPAPTSSAGSYSIGITLFPEPSISITYTPPSSTGPSISVSTTPYYVNQWQYYAYNITWTFDYTLVSELPNNGVLINGFQVGPSWGAAIFLTNYSPGNTYWFYLPFNAEVETFCWSAWANMVWIVGLATSSSNTVSISIAYFGYPPFQQPNAPSGSWISGYSIQCINGNVSLSGPS